MLKRDDNNPWFVKNLWDKLLNNETIESYRKDLSRDPIRVWGRL